MSNANEVIATIAETEDKLDPAVKATWLTALRSGSYRQTDNWLKCEDAYCCLGVLGATNGIEVRENENSGVANYVIDGKFYNCMLPDGAFNLSEVTMGGLAELNDDYEYSFDQIADVIEKYL